MKKAIPIIIILIIAGGGIWYTLQPPAVTLSLLSPLPDNTMVVTRFVELERSIEQLQAGTFAQKLKEVDIQGAIDEIEGADEDLEELQEVIEDFLDTVNSQSFQELFGQDVIVAMLPDKIEEITPDAAEEMLGSVILVSRPKHRAEALGFIGDLFTDETTLATISYKEHEIKHFMLDEEVPAYYSFIGGILVGTLDKQTMQECLDRLDQQGPTLKDNERYAGMMSKIERSDARMVWYIDGEALYSFCSDAVEGNLKTEEERAQVHQSLAGMKGAKDIGMAFYDDGTEILETRALALFDRNAADPYYEKMYSLEPADNETLRMVSGNPLLYYWTNSPSLQMYWDLILGSEAIEAQERESIDEAVRQQAGLYPDEIFSALGNQWGLAIADISTNSFIPIPKLVLFIEMRDQQAVEQAIASSVSKTMMELQADEYEGITIRSLPLPFGADVQPAYAFLNGFCLIAMNNQLIREAIDAHESGEALTKTQAFEAVDRGLSGKNNTVFFMNVKECIEAGKEVIAWQQKMAMFKNPERAQESALVMEKVVYPLLESFQVIEAISSRVVFGEDALEANSYIKVDRE